MYMYGCILYLTIRQVAITGPVAKQWKSLIGQKSIIKVFVYVYRGIQFYILVLSFYTELLLFKNNVRLKN